MAKLFVGCRVRLVGPWYGPAEESPRGMEGRIEMEGDFYGESGLPYRWAVAVPAVGDYFLANSDELEPIVPEGQQPVEISKLLSEFPELEKALSVSA